MSHVSLNFENKTETSKKNLQPKLGIYFTLGDFGLETSLKILEGAAAGGAELLEVGIPFSDPLLDGDVITTSHQRALEHCRIEKKDRMQLLGAIERLRKSIPQSTQISLMLCSNLIYDEFWLKALPFVDGILITDIQTHAKSRFPLLGKRVWFVTPSSLENFQTPNNFGLNEYPETCSMVYLARLQGVTGERSNKNFSLNGSIRTIGKFTSQPVWTGFGISNWADVLADFSQGATGSIVGSKFVAAAQLYAKQNNSADSNHFFEWSRKWVQEFRNGKII
jgi:tryptophan synthase alpha chain